MGNSIFGISLTGLSAAQAGLVTTGHNISNAGTPGYNRQQIVQTTGIPQQTGVGFFGQGVEITTVRRLYGQFVANQALSAQTEGSRLDAYHSQIRQIDNLLSDPATGLSSALQDFFKGVNDVAASPQAAPARQAMLSSAEALVSRFLGLDRRFTEIRNGVNGEIADSTALINAYARQIAQLNENILLAQSNAGGQPANDLLDRRDVLIADLNREVRATVVPQDDGSYNVFIGNGQALVVGQEAFTLKTTMSSTGATEVAYETGGNTIPLQEDSLQGGRLGGLLAFRNESLEPARNALGRVAIGLAGAFNDQHRLGQDLSGAPGGAFFRLADAEVNSYSGNSGGAALSVSFSDYGALTTSDYRLAYDGTNYTLTRLSDGTAQIFAALPQTVDGFSLNLASGAPAAGDRFLIRPTANGARDIAVAAASASAIAAAAPIRTAAAMANTGTGRISPGAVDAPPPVNANLTQPVTLTFTGPASFDVSGAGTGNPSGVSYTPGGNISYNGWTVQITGTPAAGDSFTIGPNTNGVADNRNVLLLAALQTRSLLASGAATYQQAYGQLVSEVGGKTRELEVASAAQEQVISQSEQARQSVSGVNLDEEAGNLMRYQQAYQASAKALQVASRLFETLLDLGR